MDLIGDCAVVQLDNGLTVFPSLSGVTRVCDSRAATPTSPYTSTTQLTTSGSHDQSNTTALSCPSHGSLLGGPTPSDMKLTGRTRKLMRRLEKPRCTLGTLPNIQEEQEDPGQTGATDDQRQSDEVGADDASLDRDEGECGSTVTSPTPWQSAAMDDLWARHLEAAATPHGCTEAAYGARLIRFEDIVIIDPTSTHRGQTGAVLKSRRDVVAVLLDNDLQADVRPFGVGRLSDLIGDYDVGAGMDLDTDNDSSSTPLCFTPTAHDGITLAEDAPDEEAMWHPLCKEMDGWAGPPHLTYKRGDYVMITAPCSPHCGRRGLVHSISSDQVTVQLKYELHVSTILAGVAGAWTLLQDPVAIDFRRSQARSDHYLFECICNNCWTDNLTAFAGETNQPGADEEACHGEALPRGASVVIIDPPHPFWGHIGTVLNPHRDAVDVQLRLPGPTHRGSAPPELTVAVRPFGAESLNSFCDMSDDDDDGEAPDVDIGRLLGITAPAKSHHDASANARSHHDASLARGIPPGEPRLLAGM